MGDTLLCLVVVECDQLLCLVVVVGDKLLCLVVVVGDKWLLEPFLMTGIMSKVFSSPPSPPLYPVSYCVS